MEIAQIEEQQQLTPEEEQIVNEMVEAGVLYGRKHSKLNPKMSKYIISTRRGVDIIDVLQTNELIEDAAKFLKEIMEKKLPILVVGIKPAIKDIVKDFAVKFGFSYVEERWLGGTMTNFKAITKRVDNFKKLRADKESGKLDKYTKKEQLLISRDLAKMARNFTGIENLNMLPSALIIIDTAEHKTAVNEAINLGIPIVGLINTDGDPDKVKYPIPCNDNARPSVKLILDKLAEKLKLSNG